VCAATEEVDANGKGDMWSFGLTMLSFLRGYEPFHECHTRSQVDTELRMMWEDGAFEPSLDSYLRCIQIRMETYTHIGY
jgi:hypothetical protein